MTDDLECIPASIARLKNLKELSIYCASSDRPSPAYKPKPKEEISLNRIPPEIGELTQLEQLTIQYTSIHELPRQLVKLQNLQCLNLRMCMIDQKPEFLYDMKHLKYINVTSNSFW